MAKKSPVDEAVAEIQRTLDDAVENLNDEDYLEVLDQIASYCESYAEAKREEME